MDKDANWEHLSDELALLNARLSREVRRLRRGAESGRPDHLAGLVLSEEEILEVLSGEPDAAEGGDGDGRTDEIEARISRRREGVGLRRAPPLLQLAGLFQLGRVEEQCLVLCLAPELDWRYSKVYAFLQDDLTRKQPSVDLALRLFCKGARECVEARAVFSPASPLLSNRLVQLGEPPDGFGPLPQTPLKLDERIAAFLLATPQLDGQLRGWVELVAPWEASERAAVPDELRERTLQLVEGCFAGGEASVRPLIHLRGREGAGRRSVAECASRSVGLPLLVADARRLASVAKDRAEAVWRLGRESLLLPAAILVEHFDGLLEDGRAAELAALLDAVREFSPLTFLSGAQAWKVRRPDQLFLSLECPVPDSASRVRFWKERLADVPHVLGEDEQAELAGKFNFTAGQIDEAVEAACGLARWEGEPPRPLTAAMLNQACRVVAAPHLGGLARKLEPCHTWPDIVLPESQLVQLREIAAHVKRAHLVMEEWGFGQKLPYGRGVTALFQGMSGTGKTMAAGIIGAELGLDLYKIDLSSVVSKYIGETEKNLERIFTEAQDSSAVLFFDEADALFGKRSEVKDAHDRYANIETAYLLQRMEDYSGVVILATNMKQNMDAAFVRRMRFIVHFPFPDDAERQRIWERAFPAGAPLAPGVDFSWLARKLKITGGHIKNISLRAAFLASERQCAIGMDCLVEAARREIEKMGRITPLADFRAPARAGEVREAAGVA